MTLYRIVLFGHIAGVIGLFAALALEWVSLRHLAKSSTYGEARAWSSLWSLLLPLGMPATLLVLGSGIYMATTVGAWELGWVKLAVPTLIMVAIGGAIVGPRRTRLAKALTEGEGPLSSGRLQELQHPLYVASLRWRAALLVSLVFVMTARPESALLVVGSCALAGVLWGLPAWRKKPAPHVAPG
jgi:hypothetical protein